MVEANLFQQLSAIEDFCRKHMFMSGDQDDFDSKNELTVPLKVVREAALNLLTHRTWWSEARTPSVNIFDDRIEFMNPGAFPQGTTPEVFRSRPHSEPINEKIASALFKGGKAEGWGRGILNIFTYCKKAGLPEPEYDFVTNFVCLTIRFKTPLAPYVTSGDPINDPINGLIKGPLKIIIGQVYQIILANPGVKKSEIAIRIGKSVSSVKRYVKVLTDNNLIEYRDSKKTGGLYPL